MRFLALLLVATVAIVLAGRKDRDDRSADLDRYPDHIREKIESRLKTRRPDRPDIDEDFMSRHRDRHTSRSHEDRARSEKEENFKHRDFLRSRRDKFIDRIHATNMEEEEKKSLQAMMEELHEHELSLADSRLQITLDFEGVREMTDKDKRRAYLDEKRQKREIQREKDNVKRERIREIREHVDHRLHLAERGGSASEL